MDQTIKANLYPCAHCEQTGTCKNGDDGNSCMACVQANEVKGKNIKGLMCGSCNGIGLAEPKTERMNKRIKPVLAMIIVFLLMAGIYASALLNSQYFGEILAFSATLLGSIIGYYYSARVNQNA